MMPARLFACLLIVSCTTSRHFADGQPTRQTAAYQRIKAYLDSVPAIDTHDHLWPFDKLPGLVETDRGRGMNLASLCGTATTPGTTR
jgi:hypothetical protein